MNFKNLFKKGWNEKEVKHAKVHLKKSKKTLWAVLVTVISGNLIASLLLLAMSLFFKQWAIYGLVIILAGLIGHVYGKLVEEKNQIAELIVGLIAFFNVVIAVFVSNIIKTNYSVEYFVNPWIVGGLYGLIYLIVSFVSSKK